MIHLDYEAHSQHKAFQRYEFLGDAVLDFIVITSLFSLLPNAQTDLATYKTALVSNKVLFPEYRCIANILQFLAAFAELKGIKPYIVNTADNLYKDKATMTGVLGDSCEAILGAIFLDQGINAVS